METVGKAKVYEFKREDMIGNGAFAAVFKGRRVKGPPCTVAIKRIDKKNLSRGQNLLEKEIKILTELTELHHENVVALLDCETNADIPYVYLVMEYCNGGDLADYLHAKGTLSEDTIRLFFVQLAAAMEAIYAKGIIHRDLKPQNILLTHNGMKKYPQPSEITLKIADFGFARFLKDGNMAATLCGSPMYMAPEVIMSLQYDAKADLWSLGTIVYQCLTGNAPFQAKTPQDLKRFYEMNGNLSPKFPGGTSPELSDLLINLLKRNPMERMSFESFFTHKFLKKHEPCPSPSQGELPLPIYGTPPKFIKQAPRASTPIRVATSPASQPESPRSTRNALSSSPEDDYVIVPKHIPIQSDHSSETSVEKEKPTFRLPVRASPMPCAPIASPTRPSFLPISEPIPVPNQREAYEKIHNITRNDKEEPSSPLKLDSPSSSGSVPRSLPITMKKRPERQISDIEMSPPSVQFVIGTPPTSGRRRSTSSSLCETPPPSNVWTVSPSSTSKNTPSTSPLRISGTPPPILKGPLARVPMLSTPNLNDNNNLGRSPVIPFCTRAVTLPEISELDNYPTLFNETSGTNDAHPIMFLAPELEEETLLEKEHNETLAKINFVLALSNCILELAGQRAAPLSSLVEPSQYQQPMTESTRRAEQLVLMVRALQLLSSGLSLATRQLKSGQLRPSTTVKNVVTTLNAKFKSTLQECKQLNNTGLLNRVGSSVATADKILYNHALQMCRSAALDELFGVPEECFQRYQTAQILLHSLLQQVQNQEDKMLLTKYREAVEKRLFVLQQQGYIYAKDLS